MSVLIPFIIASCAVTIPYIVMRVAHWLRREEPDLFERPEHWGVM